jgi:hypothetical protein
VDDLAHTLWVARARCAYIRSASGSTPGIELCFLGGHGTNYMNQMLKSVN